MLLVFSVLFFSWLPHPSFRELSFFPNWLVKWTDEYGNLRTAVPFVPLSIFLKTTIRKSYCFCFCTCVCLAMIAEIGQLLLPLRNFDVMDVGYASMGSLIGLCILFILNVLKNFIKQ
jgi:glycopeptide antibiotics resistance protein